MAEREDELGPDISMEEFVEQSHKDRSVEPAKPSQEGDEQRIADELEDE